MSAGSIAVVGMACIFPGAPDLDAYWHNLVDGVDAISDVPPARWDPVYYDPSSSSPDRLYCKRGGFIDEHAFFDPTEFGIMPLAAEGADPDQLLTLRLGAHVLADAGYEARPFERERTSVVLGKGGYPGRAQFSLFQHVRVAQEVVETLQQLLPELGEDALADVKRAFQQRLPPYGPDTAIGTVSNIAASRLANRLDLGGPAYTVDGACASSLLAVEHACRDLRGGVVDMAIAGGAHVCQDESFWSVLSQLGAVSRQGQIRPFDRNADGLLIGEGLGLLALKRLADAERDDDRIYAVIQGIGSSSDGRSASLMSPAPTGQQRALEAAWRESGLDRTTVGLVEAHGTATPVGDAAELGTLARVFGPANGARRACLGSVKSMIGHAMPAAGVAGLIKAVLAVHHGVLLPTLHSDDPNPAIEQTRFRLLKEPEPWDGRRRAGVSAFGFGGVNAHAVLEAHGSPAHRSRRPAAAARPADDVLVASAGSQEELLAVLDGRATSALDGRWRVAVADPTPERLARVRKAVESGKPRRGRDGINLASSGLVAGGGLVAFLFPGIEASFEPRVDDVETFAGRAAADSPEASDIELQGLGVIDVGRLLHAALADLNVHPDIVAGHSIGEWAAMVASGMFSDKAVDEFIDSLAPGSLEMPGFAFAAVGCGAARARELIGERAGVVVAADNCPHQSVICGPEDDVRAVLEVFRSDRVLAELLESPRGGFHTPGFADYVDPLDHHLRTLPLQPANVPLWSATTCAPYPTEPYAIYDLARQHLVCPVRFRELVLALYEHGVRAFVQVGTGNLSGFIDDTLRGREYLSIPANVPQRAGMAQLRRLAVALWVEGVPVALERLGISTARKPTGKLLDLGIPLFRPDPSLRPPGTRSLTARPVAGPSSADDPLLAEFEAGVRELEAAQRDVIEALESRRRSRRSPSSGRRDGVPRTLEEQRTFSLLNDPHLIDHCLIPQPEGWPDTFARRPVQPLTTSIDVLLEFAQRLSGRQPVALERFRAHAWLVVEPPCTTTLRGSYDGASTVDVSIDGHAEARVLVGDAPARARAPDPTPLSNERPPPVSDRGRIYSDRWLFHGPAYQGIVEIHGFGDDGISAELEVLPAPGALLDATGQLLGLWIVFAHETDRVAMPVGLSRAELLAPFPEAGERVRCVVRVRRVTSRSITADIELIHDGEVFVRIEGWEDWRFETDDALWSMITAPERTILAVPHEDGFVSFDGGARARREDDLVYRYLTASEFAEYEALSAPRSGDWLAGRIAAKDAVRNLLFGQGVEEIYPVEVEISTGPSGKPIVHAPGDLDIGVSIAHKDRFALALAALDSAPGIDFEPIGPREDAFVRRAFVQAELEFVPAHDRDEWLTRLWCAKEALGKARGTGLGDPQTMTVTELQFERVRVDDIWVETKRVDDRVIAWTSIRPHNGGSHE